MQDRELLGNVLDALDRLFDRESSVIDVWALLHATSAAVHSTVQRDQLERSGRELLTIVRAGGDPELQRDRALEVTDTLRRDLAKLLQQ